MNKWLNIRTLAFIFWVALVTVMLIVMPDLDKLVREKGQLEVPEIAESRQAAELEAELDGSGVPTYNMVLVFHNKEGLTEAQRVNVNATVNELLAEKETLGIVKMLAHTESEQAEKQLIAEDGTTILTQINIDKAQGQVHEVTEKLYKKIEMDQIETYITGADVISDDFTRSTQEGVKKTEIIAVVFILVVLILIFRSPVIPIISLITVGVSYIVSLSIVTLLVEHFNMPFSNFTQVFLVVILFGIGTDYNILLFTRFKEELAATNHILKAITNTYKTAGKTVVYSGIAVLIGFIALFFAQFKMYLATAPVAVGVAVLLAVLLTLNPFFMAVFGLKLFWPIKKIEGHGESKFWHVLAKNSYYRPFIALIFIALLLVPGIVKYSGELNFNDLNEIDDSYLSKQAVSLIEEHYVAGFASPISFVMKDDVSMATQEKLQTLDEIATAIEAVDGVAKVYSVTRPEAERIEDLYVEKQTGTLNEGLVEAEDGISEISSGLEGVKNQLDEPQDLSGVQTLINGTSQLQTGAQQLQRALTNLTTGLNEGASGAAELATGLDQIEQNIVPLVNGVNELATAYATLQGGFSQMGQYIDGSAAMIAQSKAAFTQIERSMKTVIAANPELEENNDAKTVVSAAQQALASLAQIEAQSAQVSTQYKHAVAGFAQANNSLANVQAGLAQLQGGIRQLQDGATTLSSGISTAAIGSSTIAKESTQFVNGLAQVNDGQKQLQSSLGDLQQQIAQLSSGLQKGANGLTRIEEGLQDANKYLQQISSKEKVTFYIPQEVLEGEEFAESLDTYMSEDRTMTSMTILLDVNPFTAEAMDIGKDIRQAIEAALKGSNLQQAEAYVGGKTMTNVDLQQIAADDFLRSAIIMLTGIAVVLLIITRSIFQTLVTVASLILATFASLGIAELLNVSLLDQQHLSWNVPFFSFIMIVALGVDYSIFLLMRYNENPELGTTGIIPAAMQMGGVVISAAIILGGTFAALIPSGILSLIQVAFVVIVGLVILSCIMMPAFLPMMLGLREKLLNFKFGKK